MMHTMNKLLCLMVPGCALLFVGFVGLIVFLWYWNSQQAKKRREMLAAFAASRGLMFTPAKDATLYQRYAAFNCLARGDNRYGYNLLYGPWGRRSILMFDYHYETHSTDSKGNRTTHNHHFSAVMLFSDLPLKPLFIRPENFLDRIGEFFGFDDIDFESAEFSRRFLVKAPDKKWAYDVLHARSMEFLLSCPGYQIQFDVGAVMVWKDSTFELAEFQQATGIAEGLLDRLPDYVIQQQKSDMAAPPPRNGATNV